jgi:hypothetical protein
MGWALFCRQLALLPARAKDELLSAWGKPCENLGDDTEPRECSLLFRSSFGVPARTGLASRPVLRKMICRGSGWSRAAQLQETLIINGFHNWRGHPRAAETKYAMRPPFSPPGVGAAAAIHAYPEIQHEVCRANPGQCPSRRHRSQWRVNTLERIRDSAWRGPKN